MLGAIHEDLAKKGDQHSLGISDSLKVVSKRLYEHDKSISSLNSRVGDEKKEQIAEDAKLHREVDAMRSRITDLMA